MLSTLTELKVAFKNIDRKYLNHYIDDERLAMLREDYERLLANANDKLVYYGFKLVLSDYNYYDGTIDATIDVIDTITNEPIRDLNTLINKGRIRRRVKE